MGYQRREHRELQVVVPQAGLDQGRENPYTPPPSAAAGVLAPQRRRTAIKAKADPANPAVMRTVRPACGPASIVTGRAACRAAA